MLQRKVLSDMADHPAFQEHPSEEPSTVNHFVVRGPESLQKIRKASFHTPSTAPVQRLKEAGLSPYERRLVKHLNTLALAYL